MKNEKEKEKQRLYLLARDDVTSNNIVLCLKKAEPYESALGKDLSEWNASEIIDFYKSLCTPSLDFLKNINSVYKAFTNWCLKENLLKDNINHYDEITNEILLKCVNKDMADQRIITRERLLEEIKKFENPREQFLCLACFEGLAGHELEEIINVKLSDFQNGMIVNLKHRDPIPYSKELYKYAMEAANTYIFVQLDTAGRYREFEMRGDSDTIVKKIISNNVSDNDEPIKVQMIYRIFKEIQKSTNIPAFTSKALKESGRIHRIKELVKQHEGWTVMDAIKDPSVSHIYGRLLSYKEYVMKYNEFLA